MPTLAQVLKDEISRLARKEAKAAVAKVKADNVKLRKSNSELRKRVAAIEKANQRLTAGAGGGAGSGAGAAAPAPAAGAPAEDAVKKARFTARSVRALRKKFGMSQAEFARLLGVSSQIIAVWENKQGSLNMRDNARAALVEARGMGAREARQKLAEKEAA